MKDPNFALANSAASQILLFEKCTDAGTYEMAKAYQWMSQRVDDLTEALVRERLRLAAVGVAARGGDVSGIEPQYDSDSLQAVLALQVISDWQTLHRRCQLAEAEVARMHSTLTTQHDPREGAE